MKCKATLVFFYTLVYSIVLSQSAFIDNQGQWDASILYKAEFQGGNLYLEHNGLNYNFYDLDAFHHLVNEHHAITYPYEKKPDWTIKGHCLKMEFENGNFSKSNVYENLKTNTYYNFYLGKDKNNWQSKVPAFQELEFTNIYDGVDVKFYSSGNQFKYDIVVQNVNELNQIKINYQGAESLKLKDGNLIIKTSVNEFIEQKPYAYQIVKGEKLEVACNFSLNNNQLSFEFPNGIIANAPIVIDPYIVFSRYSSSFANNFGYTATYDSYGNAYGAGSVFNIGYITTPGAYDITFNGASTDIGITKYTPDGLNRIYATYLGGNDTELPHSIVVNSRDELFVLGTTSSSDFPTTALCFDSTFAGGTLSNLAQGLGVIYHVGSDLIIAHFSEDGTQLMASTYVGGSANDGLNLSPVLKYNYADEVRGEIIIDEDDNCLISSCSYSNDFPVKDGIDSSYNGGLDGVVFKMDENLTQLIWSTYLGGALDDASYSINLNSQGDVFLAGGTQSIDFPIANAFQATYNGGQADGFITKIHQSGAQLISSSYYGTTEYDQIYFLDNNNNDDVHVFGQTKAPTGQLINNAVYNHLNGGQFLTKFNADVNQIIWSTRFGDGAGKPDISPTAFLVDVCNQVFLSGWGGPNLAGNTNLSGTAGLDVTNDAIDNSTDNADFYFMVMRDDASSLIYASFFGGAQSAEHVDGGTSRFDKKGVMYQAVCAGCGGHQDFPTIPLDSIGFWNNNNSCNLGLVKYAFSPPSVVADFLLPQVQCAPQQLHFTNTSTSAYNDTSATTYYWKVNGVLVTNEFHFDSLFSNAGNYTIQLLVIDSNSCNLMDSITKQITIIGNSIQNLDTAFICDGQSVQIGITPIGGAGITYAWTPLQGLSSGTVANPIANPTQNTQYTLVVSNGNCIDTFIQQVNIENFNFTLQFEDSVCLNDTLRVDAIAQGNVFYSWSPTSALLSAQGQAQAVFIAQNPMLISCTATNASACSFTLDTTVYVIAQLPDITASASPDTIEIGDTSQLFVFSSVSNSFQWQSAPSLSATDIDNPFAFPTENTTYYVEVSDGNCPNKTEVTVYVKLPKCIEDKIYVPNAFTPNKDGNNDVFYVRNLAPIDNFYFTIYDRWGQIVFETHDINTGWDGTFEGELLNTASFAWYCRGKCENGEDFFIKGNVTLLY